MGEGNLDADLTTNVESLTIRLQEQQQRHAVLLSNFHLFLILHFISLSTISPGMSMKNTNITLLSKK